MNVNIWDSDDRVFTSDMIFTASSKVWIIDFKFTKFDLDVYLAVENIDEGEKQQELHPCWSVVRNWEINFNVSPLMNYQSGQIYLIFDQSMTN